MEINTQKTMQNRSSALNYKPSNEHKDTAFVQRPIFNSSRSYNKEKPSTFNIEFSSISRPKSPVPIPRKNKETDSQREVLRPEKLRHFTSESSSYFTSPEKVKETEKIIAGKTKKTRERASSDRTKCSRSLSKPNFIPPSTLSHGPTLRSSLHRPILTVHHPSEGSHISSSEPSGTPVK